MKWVGIVTAYLVTAVFFCLIFRYLGDFSSQQSVVLALAIAWISRSIVNVNESMVAKPTKRFRPYYVRVSPDWYSLLPEFKLVGDVNEWCAIRDSLEEDHILNSGFWLTVTHQSDDFERSLIYSNNHRVFVSQFDFVENLNPIRTKREDGPYIVEFFMNAGRDGYNLGVNVPGWWWNEVKASCPKPTHEDDNPVSGRVELVLATISYSEFDLYWEPVEGFHEKTAKQIRDRRAEERQKRGWKTIQHPYVPELDIESPESIEHKYFAVEHGAI